MKEVKENLKKTINDTCEWLQNELKSEEMPPEVVATIPETLKAISNLAETLKSYITV